MGQLEKLHLKNANNKVRLSVVDGSLNIWGTNIFSTYSKPALKKN